ncbi:HTH-like domain-containing protein [Cellulomonas sp. KH9]|nr:HTH-like domain-containing protein [Cellulomonas sp. KH9]
MYPLVGDLAADGIPVAVTCRVLGFSKQAYYAWRSRPVTDRDWDDAHLINAAIDIHHDDPEFGYRFIADELPARGIVAGRNRVHRLCSTARLFSAHSKKRGTARRPGPPVHDDLVERNFTADRPNRLWLTDITEHPTAEGKIYLCAIKDACTNRIVGYSIDNRMTSQLAVNALANAVALRRPAGTVVHSDRGSQGGFNRSSQHLEIVEVFDGSSAAGSGPGRAPEVALTGSSEVPARRGGSLLGGDREGVAADRSRRSSQRGARGRSTLVPQRWRHGALRSEAPAHRAVSVVR